MLRVLRIRNLAVIESVEVEFDPGFNVLTGETGAGKSIVVEAVGLLLGGRASADLVRTGEPQATIEAVFEDEGKTWLVRREVTSQGRSRSFINGALATASALRELSLRLVELHGQHEHQALLDPLSHLPLLDSHAHLEPLVDRVATAWRTVRTLREQLDRSRMDEREKAARLELISFQLGEIDKAAPRAGEDEELATEKHVLANAERVRRLCEEGYAALYENDDAVLAGLSRVWKRVDELASIDGSLRSTWRRATASSPSSRICRLSCAVTRTASMRPPDASSRSRIASRFSSASSGSTARRSRTSSRREARCAVSVSC
jgi:DNA repair protein RecN (Recombination protein N)